MTATTVIKSNQQEDTLQAQEPQEQQQAVVVPPPQGEYRATGRRKTATARVRLVPGTGKITINGRPLEDYFPKLYHQLTVTRAFQIVGRRELFDVIIRVDGGGLTGQAEAKINRRRSLSPPGRSACPTAAPIRRWRRSPRR